MPMNTSPPQNILTRIVRTKQSEVVARCRVQPVEQLKEIVMDQPPPRGFAAAIETKVTSGGAAVIAEIKKASPSRGVICVDFDPGEIAIAYEQAGAACLSVLTDESWFQGCDEYLRLARCNTSLPVLRKDFIIDVYQVYEARAIGADCVLLIVSILDIKALHEYYNLATELGMDVLVEVHNQQELDTALTLSPMLLGINNRDLNTFEVNLDTTLALLDSIPAGIRVITESGIHDQEDVARMLSHQVYGFLVGEALMGAASPGQALTALFGSHLDLYATLRHP